MIQDLDEYTVTEDIQVTKSSVEWRGLSPGLRARFSDLPPGRFVTCQGAGILNTSSKSVGCCRVACSLIW